jgi:hypothetical protein
MQPLFEAPFSPRTLFALVATRNWPSLQDHQLSSSCSRFFGKFQDHISRVRTLKNLRSPRAHESAFISKPHACSRFDGTHF